MFINILPPPARKSNMVDNSSFVAANVGYTAARAPTLFQLQKNTVQHFTIILCTGKLSW